MTTLSTPLLAKRKPRRRTAPTPPPTQPQRRASTQPQSSPQPQPSTHPQPGPVTTRDQRHDRLQLIMTLKVVVLVILTVFSLRAGVPGLAILFLAGATLSLRSTRP